MGDFPFLTNAFGSYGLTMPTENLNVLRASNDTLFLTYAMARDQFTSNRTGKSSNKPNLLSGTTTRWRSPSSYKREGLRFEAVTKGSYLLGPTKGLKCKDSYFDRTYVTTSWTNSDENRLFSKGTTSPNFGAGDVKNVDNTAVSKALSDLASSKASMGENLATLNQTADLFGTVAEASLDLYRAALALKRGRFRQLLNFNARSLKKLVRERKLERRVANYWLTYWYGFKPLVSDAYGIWELLQEQSKPALLVHGRGRAVDSENKTFNGFKDSSSLAPRFVFHDVSSVGCSYSITGRLDNNQLYRNLNRIGMVNPLSLIWELTPFSFVIDWGVPVGQVLSNLTASSGLTFVGGSVSWRWERELTATIDSGWSAGVSPTSHIWGFGTSRTPLSKFPVGGLYAKPFFTGASRFATIASLLSNLTSGLR